MHQQRIELADTPADVIRKLSEGNRAAVSVLSSTALRGETIDPDNVFGAFGASVTLDVLGIYGGRIWLLYKDVCGEDLVRMIALLRAVQLGLLPEDTLQAALDNPRLLPPDQIDALVAQVRERLPRFGASAG